MNSTLLTPSSIKFKKLPIAYVPLNTAREFAHAYRERYPALLPSGTKRQLTPMDKMRLEAARGVDVKGSLPSVARYNELVNTNKLAGRTIIPIGAQGIE